MARMRVVARRHLDQLNIRAAPHVGSLASDGMLSLHADIVAIRDLAERGHRSAEVWRLSVLAERLIATLRVCVAAANALTWIVGVDLALPEMTGRIPAPAAAFLDMEASEIGHAGAVRRLIASLRHARAAGAT